MAVLECLIEATKGTQKKYYQASVEEDGFIYFNDRRFFRVETPSNIHDIETSGTTIQITSGIQYWYVVRDVWVYANEFDLLELSMPAGFDVTTLQPAFDEVILDINNFGSWAIGTNGQVLLDLYNGVTQIVTDLGNQGITVTQLPQATIYNNWANFPNIQL